MRHPLRRAATAAAAVLQREAPSSITKLTAAVEAEASKVSSATSGGGAAASSLVAARADDASSDVRLLWCDGVQRTFHQTWLRDNCAKHRHPSSRQKVASVTDIDGLGVRQVSAEGERLHVTWEPDGATSEYSAAWLRQLGDCISELSESPAPAGACDTAAAPCMPRFSYAELLREGEPAIWAWLSQLQQTGVTLLEGVPREAHRVAEAAALIGPLQPQIYGDVWDVVSQEDAINIAYTGEALEPHMDLCYYESPPGLQLLHAMRFDAAVRGGESTVVDAFAVAERFRHEQPAAFATLARVPATFLKDHADRAEPVLLTYQRPHLALGPAGRLTGVFWSPPFEGPLLAPPADAALYYEAYAAFRAAIAAAPSLTYRLQEGEMLVFNNRRMLHGRRAFAQHGGRRHLRGCYVNIDEFANRFNLLRRRYGASGQPALPAPLGNQDWASARELGLPPRGSVASR